MTGRLADAHHQRQRPWADAPPWGAGSRALGGWAAAGALAVAAQDRHARRTWMAGGPLAASTGSRLIADVTIFGSCGSPLKKLCSAVLGSHGVEATPRVSAMPRQVANEGIKQGPMQVGMGGLAMR